MTIYELKKDSIRAITATRFKDVNVTERGDLQRLLRDQIEIIAPNTLVISEEFGEWEDSRRRIDLLCVDSEANIVVIELKRTEDGRHMELQSLRYSAMVSNMTFEQAVDSFSNYLAHRQDERKAEEVLLEFFGWDEPNEEDFGNAVRIILVSADFSKELTSTVLWLSDFGLDFRCVRLRPYSHNSQILIDVQQVIPLPEAEDFQIRVREKQESRNRRNWNQKSKDEIWEMMEGKCDEEVVQLARGIVNWIEPLVSRTFPTANGFACRLTASNKKYFFFKVRADGMIEVWFQYLENKPPFNDPKVQAEFLTRLNRIKGLSFSADRFRGKPTIDTSLLLEIEQLNHFKETIEWAIGLANSFQN